MIIQLPQDLISPPLEQELQFRNYLNIFSKNIPLLPSVHLNLLTEEEAKEHYALLLEIAEKAKSKQISLEQLLGQGSLSPFLGPLLPFFKQQELAPYHLFELMQFISNEQCLLQSETCLSNLQESWKKETLNWLKQLEEILERHTLEGGSHLRLSDKAKGHQENIRHLDRLLADEYEALEKQIWQTCNLKMIYPYPQELVLDDPRLREIQNSSLVQVQESNGLMIVSYILPSKIIALQNEREEEQKKLTIEGQDQMSKINHALAPHYSSFVTYYTWRQKQLYCYVLTLTSIERGFEFPTFCEKNELLLISGRLPSLEEKVSKRYIPLTLSLKEGSNLLYGANMAGKTTVLKTLYFILRLVTLGLPIPAKSLSLRFPKNLSLLLKSSGQLQQGISSFGEELNFFTQEVKPGDYILADELFQTTNPQSGVQLSQLVLESMREARAVFFATTHYPDLIHSPAIELYRMKEMVFPRALDRQLSPEDLLGKIPFEVEKVEGDRTQAIAQDLITPLAIAAHFPLFSPLSEKVRDTFLKRSESKK